MIFRLLSTATLAALTYAAPPATDLRAPKGYTVAIEAHTVATSVQIYTCASGKWSGPDPDALISGAGLTIHHYKGPTWEVTDGSIVHGSNAKHFAAPNPGAVDWLELDASGGTGRFAGVSYIHRIETSGGVAPAAGCDGAHEGEQARVPYSATYLFYVPLTR
ncbi:MAG TPA: DUF3455 domain-containing protein [Bryobacteraceae bacterium]|nr:DUF3455 domain-containing protein [Bryobacteraceae bacterium]